MLFFFFSDFQRLKGGFKINRQFSLKDIRKETTFFLFLIENLKALPIRFREIDNSFSRSAIKIWSLMQSKNGSKKTFFLPTLRLFPSKTISSYNSFRDIFELTSSSSPFLFFARSKIEFTWKSREFEARGFSCCYCHR